MSSLYQAYSSAPLKSEEIKKQFRHKHNTMMIGTGLELDYVYAWLKTGLNVQVICESHSKDYDKYYSTYKKRMVHMYELQILR